ncbi:MAG: AAC(3) family N-acetyltransferase [Clostridia bacterium]|nr:AAC(3) family N-acetyltransferase [Clostridia bacterium]
MMNHIYTKSELLSQLEALRLPRDRVVLMHSSLRLVGQIEGGAKTLLDALIEYFTAQGGLFCVPTHTWANLWATDKEFVLDVNDPHTCLGAFSDFAAADGRGIRTENPTHSMVVFGDRAKTEAFAANEIDVSSGTAPESCYGKLYEMGGYVLLVGVSHARNTYLHAVDEMLNVPNRITEQTREVKIKRESGEIVTRHIHSHHCSFTPDISARFPQFETAFCYYGAITDGHLGNAPVQACDARIMKQVMEVIFSRADRDPLSDEAALLPLWYVRK